jgi:hypothetical protein
MNWERAEKQAMEWGGHLVTINDRQEELWLKGQFGQCEYFWIGFNDIALEGNVEEKNEENWEWVSGEPDPYANWSEGEPNNGGREGMPEDAAVMNWGGPAELFDGRLFFLYGDGWNDIPIHEPRRGIVERLGL